MDTPNTFPSSLRRTQFFSMLLVYGALMLWLGSLVFFGFGVASTVFTHIPSRDLAGTVNGVILGKLTIIELVAGALLLSGLLLYNLKLGKLWAKIPIGIAGVMLVLSFVYGIVIRSSMDDVKAALGSFDSPTEQNVELRAEFNSYHKLYSRLVGINLGLGLVTFLWQTLLFVYPDKVTRILQTVTGTPELAQKTTDELSTQQ